MKLIDHYPETLRDLYDKLEYLQAERGAQSPTMDLPLYVVEWIRKHWAGRTLVPKWWGRLTTTPADSATLPGVTLPGVTVVADPVTTERGRELRAAVWAILACSPNAPRGQICHLATAIATLIEAEWSHNQIYVPLAPAVDRAIRDAQVWRDFSGLATIDGIISRHGLSQSSIYTIHRRLQKDKEAREQPSLPGLC